MRKFSRSEIIGIVVFLLLAVIVIIQTAKPSITARPTDPDITDHDQSVLGFSTDEILVIKIRHGDEIIEQKHLPCGSRLGDVLGYEGGEILETDHDYPYIDIKFIDGERRFIRVNIYVMPTEEEFMEKYAPNSD